MRKSRFSEAQIVAISKSSMPVRRRPSPDEGTAFMRTRSGFGKTRTRASRQTILFASSCSKNSVGAKTRSSPG